MENKIILSGGADNTLKSFKLPDKWIKEEVRKFEEMEIKNMSDTMAMLKLQKSLERDKDYNSDEDSLNGWDYLPDLDNYQYILDINENNNKYSYVNIKIFNQSNQRKE